MNIEELKATIPPITEQLPDLKTKGTAKEREGPCPKCAGKDRFVVFLDTGRFWCRRCEWKGDHLDLFCLLQGKTIKELLAGNGQPDHRQSRIVKTWDYHDADGQLIYQVCRKEPGKNGRKKYFVQRRPDGNGGWIWDMNGVDLVLYRLPTLKNSNEVWIVEGEKCVDALVDLGFVATTNTGGAGKWSDAYSETLRGKDVLLIGDNDDPGKKHLQVVGNSLNGVAASVKVIDLPDLPECGDVVDFISKFQEPADAAERLAMMADGAAPWKPEPAKPTISDAIIEISDFKRLPIKPRASYLDPWLKEDAIILVSGWRGVGKTFFALGALDAVSDGQPFGPWKCEQSTDCMLLDGEMPPADIIERSDLMNLDRKRQRSLSIYSDCHANQLGIPRANLNDEAWRGTMAETLVKRGTKVWVVDNLASLAPGLDENSRQDWDPINQWLLQLRFAGITTMMLHHTGKDGAQRGTSSREDNIDISITLKSPPDYTPEDGARFIVTFSKARISNKGLGLIQDMELKLMPEEHGRLSWTFGAVKQETRRQILNMLDEGVNQADIAKELEISKGQVSKVRSKAIKDGWLTEKNRLTMTGFSAISSGNFAGNFR